MQGGHAPQAGGSPLPAAAAEQPPLRLASLGANTSPQPVGRHDKERLKDLRGVSFKTAGGEEVHTDAKKMKRSESKALLESMMPDPDADQVVILQRIQKRLARVGLAPPSIEVRYKDLCVETTALVGSKQIPTVARTLTGTFKKVVGAGKQRHLRIIEGASGVLRPGVFTLVLAPPGSGKTTLLRALSGRLREQKDLTVTGDILYNGRSLDQFVPERSASYISQVDLHYGELTVRETFEFAAECQSRSYERELLSELHAREAELGLTVEPELDAFMKAKAFGGRHSLQVELMLHMLGLEVCADTVVGNQMMRGISGGQKKRVTSGEALVGHAKVLYADEISTGLDSNTTHQITKSLRNYCHVMNGTMLVALLQPSPETFELFDDVMLLASGMILYHGPREGVMPFFRTQLGFDCPMRKGVADFLQEIALPSDQQKYWADNTRAYRYITAQTIRQTFWESEASESQRLLLAAPAAAEKSASAHEDEKALTTEKYGASYWRLMRANFLRSWRLQLRSSLFMYVRIFQILLMSFVVATCYINVGKNTLDDGNIVMGAMFFSLIYMLIGGTVEMQLLTARLPVFWKQREMRFYPGWCFALPTFLFRVPYAVLDSTLWSLIVYWAVGFDNSWRFLIFWLFMCLTMVWAVSLFQAVACVCKTDTVSSAIGSFFMLVFMVTGGFLVTKTAIPSWWIGAYWSNPWAYITQALAVNEFTGASWNFPYNASDPNGPTMGEEVLMFRGFGTEYWWVWIGLGAVLASTVINIIVFILAATFLKGPRAKPVISEEALQELDANRESSPAHLPPSLLKDIEAGAKRSASALALNEMSRSRNASTASGLNELANGHANGASNGHAMHDSAGESTPKDSPKKRNGQQVELAGYRTTGSSTKGTPQLPGAQSPGLDTSARSKLPFEPLSLTFKDICYDVPRPKSSTGGKQNDSEVGEDTLRLLRHVSGAFRPGVLTALMGASGAGKTTLMDVLAGRKTGGVVSGEVHVNGFPKNQATFARVMGYCEQEDVHLPQATVSEALHFSATLRLPSTVDKQTRTDFVEEVLALTELDRLRDAYIGELGVSGLSVEQRKRLTIAVELVANPSIVFMDEPTSGLDARGAGLVMRAVKATVNTGRTVVCTIHQPSLEIFSEFQELLLLKRGGETIFSGAIGADAHNLISYFSSIDGVQAIKPRINPANWMLEVTSPEAEKQTGVDFAELYAGSQLAAAADAMVAKHSEPLAGEEPLRMQDLNMVSGLVQTVELTRRNFQELMRDFSYNGIRTFITLAIAICLATLYANQGQEVGTYGGVLNASGAMYAGSTFVAVMYLFTVQDSLVLRRTVFYREYAAGTFNVIPYWVAELLAEVPFLIANAMAYSLISYFAIGFIADAAKFFWYFLMVLLTLFTFVSFGMMSVHITPNLEISNAFSAFAFSLINLMSGFIKPKDAIPGGWIWLYYLDPASYSLYGMVANQLGDVDTMMQLPPGSVPAEVPVSAFVESYFGFKHSFFGWCALILIAFTVFFRLIALLALKRLNFQQR